MSFTINIDSFSEENIRERTTLTLPVDVGAEAIKVESTADYAVGDIIYVGTLGAEGCEKAVVASVVDATTLNLADALTLPHAAYGDVTSVLGDKIHIYRAVNVDDSVPGDGAFTILATREIDADQMSTYYQDSAGSSAYWYRTSYFNETTTDGTTLSEAYRGSDFGNYASLKDIRSEAGFTNAYNLKDSVIAEARRQAQSEINSTVVGRYTLPLQPVPEIIRTLTIQLAAALLKVQAYGSVRPYSDELKAARAAINGDLNIVDEDGNSTAPAGVSFYPGPDDTRLFRIEDIY